MAMEGVLLHRTKCEVANLTLLAKQLDEPSKLS